MISKFSALLLALTSAKAAMPAFTYVASQWPSIAGSTDGLGYSVAPAADAALSAQYPLSGSFVNIAVHPAASTQNCALFPSLANYGATGECYWTCDNDAVNCLRATDISTCNGANTLGLTFDDGPEPSTLNMLAYLQANNLKATFFFVGSHMVQYPEIVQAVVAAGMDVGIHTWSHHPLTSQSNDVVIAELGWTLKAFQAIAGVTPKLMRPPQGDIDDRVRGIAAAMGLTPVMWNIDTNDYTTDGNTALVSSVVSAFTTLFSNTAFPNGAVVLEHDYFQGGVDLAINNFIPLFKAKNYKMMSIADCKGLGSISGTTTSSSSATTSSSGSSSSSKGSSGETGQTSRATTASYNLFLSVAVVLSVTALLLG